MHGIIIIIITNHRTQKIQTNHSEQLPAQTENNKYKDYDETTQTTEKSPKKVDVKSGLLKNTPEYE